MKNQAVFMGMKMREYSEREYKNKYVIWKEEPFEERFFGTKTELKEFLHVGESTLDELICSNRTKEGWQVDELLFVKESSYKRKTDRPYNRKAKTLTESVAAIDSFLER